jgi:protein involved in polysaccharide export with SLBB domain
MKKMISKMTGRTGLGLGLIVMAGWFAAGCQTDDNNVKFRPVPGATDPSATNAMGVATVGPRPEVGGPSSLEIDRFTIGDLVRVIFSGTVDPIQPHEERIKADGTITLPLIGAIKADETTPGDLQKAITDAYVPAYYKRLTVTVSSDRRVYYVGGYVRNPGRQEYLGTTTVTKAIQSAGDFNDFADHRNVVLTRADGKTLTVNCLKAAKNPALDPPVFPGDKIEVKLRGLW